jgi:hypothetical protein
MAAEEAASKDRVPARAVYWTRARVAGTLGNMTRPRGFLKKTVTVH